MIYRAHHDKIDYRIIVDHKLPKDFDGYRIFYISDIHRRHIEKSTIQSVTMNIDAVVIGGDLTEKYVPLKRTKRNIEILKKWGAPIYFVWGNNDYETNTARFSALLEKENVKILANSSENVKRNHAVLSFLGLDCTTYKEARVDLALKEATGDYYILLTHIPSSFYELDKNDQEKMNIVLAGHTHGGQIRVFGVGPYEKGSFKKYKNTSILVSEGYGYTLLPFRFGTSAECHVLTLHQKRA